MSNHFAITNAIRDSEHRIAVVVVSDTSTGRKFTGGLGGTFVSTEINSCTETKFISHLPHDTADHLLSLAPGTYTFNPVNGEWI